MASGTLRELKAARLPAAPAGFIEQQPVTAADLQHPRRRAAPFNEIEQPVCGQAAARFLGEVIAVAHLAVEIHQIDALRQRRLLNCRALTAAIEIAIGAGPVAGGRKVARLRGQSGSRKAQFEHALTDPAGGSRRHRLNSLTLVATRPCKAALPRR